MMRRAVAEHSGAPRVSYDGFVGGPMRFLIALPCAAALLLLVPMGASVQARWPSRPIRFSAQSALPKPDLAPVRQSAFLAR